MTKTDRRTYLIDRYHALFGVRISELLPVSRAEIRVAAQEVYQRTKTDDSILDDDQAPIPEAETHSAGEHESGVLLSKHERQLLRREVWERRVERFRQQIAGQPLMLPA